MTKCKPNNKEYIIYKILKYTQISHEEFKLINKEVGKNSKLKERARMMESHIYFIETETTGG